MNPVRRLLAVVALAALLVLGAGIGTGFTADKVEAIDTLMVKYYDYGKFNGAVLVAREGKVIFKKGYGLANMEWNIPNIPDTKFRIGSVTKQFTSMLIMMMVKEGKIKLDGKISDYLPDYRKDTGGRVTVHHLLTHTSGIPDFTRTHAYQTMMVNPFTIDELVEKHCSRELEFEPGSKFSYDNSGYILLGAIIEKVGGRPYAELLREKILEPLGMKNTGYDFNATILPGRASGYEQTFGGFINASYIDMSIPHGAGAIYSTVEDLYLWDQALYTNKLLPEKYKKIMFTPFLGNYAYGWGVRKMSAKGSGNGGGEQQVTIYAHSGGINGFASRITRVVDDKHLVVLLNNFNTRELKKISRSIINILYGQPYEKPLQSINRVFQDTLKKGGLDAALQKYRLLRKSHEDKYDWSEVAMNNLGYGLLQMKKVDEAIAVFKLNVETYPKSANAYDSLAEAYMTKGDKKAAIENYQRSLDLDPNNSNAVQMLEKLKKAK